MPWFFEHLGELRMSIQIPQPGLKRKMRVLCDTSAGRLTVLEVSRHSLEQACALERIMIRTWAPACNTRGVHDVGQHRPRRLRPKPRSRPPSHLHSDSSRQTTPLRSMGDNLEKKLIHWQTCRPCWLRRQQVLRDLSRGFQSFYRHLTFLSTGCGAWPWAHRADSQPCPFDGCSPTTCPASRRLESH